MKNNQLVKQLTERDALLLGMAEITTIGTVLFQDSNVRFHGMAAGRFDQGLMTYSKKSCSGFHPGNLL